MAKQTSLEKCEARIIQLQARKADEIQKHGARIESARQAVAAARDKMQQAQAAGDLAAYKAAKLEMTDAETDLEFSESRLAAIEKADYLSEADGNALAEEIKAAVAEAGEADKAEALKHIEALEGIARPCKARINKGCDLLAALRSDLCRSGLHHHSIDDVALPRLVEDIINRNDYKQIAGLPIGTARREL